MALADLVPGQHAAEVHDHWWWRPGWHVGRRFYAFHITFDGQHELHRVVQAYRTALADAETVTLVPDQWLHMTMQGIGFTDEIRADDAERIAERARMTLADIRPCELQFGEIIVADEAIALPAEPSQPIHDMRAATRAAIGDVLGPDQVPEDPHRFRPHVSVAYITAGGPSEPYLAAVKAAAPEPARVQVDRVDVIEMHRDRRMYEWPPWRHCSWGDCPPSADVRHIFAN
jgi:2'-5' RNA ligase